MAERGLAVSMCMSSRTTRGSACGTAISVPHSRGTPWKPIFRAARAGNSAVRSGVTVNTTLITSSVSRLFRAMTSATSSVVPSRIASRSFASTWTAPRIALTATSLLLHAVRSEDFLPGPLLPARLQTDGRVQLTYLTGGQRAGGARPLRPQRDRHAAGAGPPADRVADLGQHPPHDVL